MLLISSETTAMLLKNNAPYFTRSRRTPMHTLKRIISRYMQMLTFFSLTLILIVIVYIQTTIEQRRAHDMAMRTFSQIEQVLEENQKELSEIQETYRKTCLHNAEAIARIIEGEPDIVYHTEELKKIAEITEVDEIHIFDNTGRVYAGTHPEYFGYTFDSGEQIMFFKPMLEDKSLQLVQDITPNTAQGKLMQYSALWSRNGDFIVQIGMEPVSVMKVTEKNELSYIFSLLRVNPEANYYAIDTETGEIVGATASEHVGKKADAIGLDFDNIEANKYGFFATIGGEKTYCVFKKAGDNYLGRVILSSELYQRIPTTAFQFAVCLIVTALILSHAATSYMNKYVVERIHEVNQKLHSITSGNLNETIDIQSSFEFSELSSYLNSMIKKLELERDIDLLTGLYNRRGMDNRLTALFQEPEKLGCSAFIMIDADGLKEINDTYGNEKGDLYLKNIAHIINNFGSKCSITARQSGDEFILFLYGYDNERELIDTIRTLEHIQNHSTAQLDTDICTRLGFSFGYCVTKPDITYPELIKEADKKMYENKRERKKCSLSCR